MAFVGANRDELDLSQFPKDSFYDPKRDDDLSGVQVRATITFKITNPDGTVVKEWTEPAHSLNLMFTNFMYALWGATSVGLTDTNGVEINIDGASGGTSPINAPSGDDTYGIVIGSGATPGSTPAPTTVSLVAPIPAGINAGQIEYGAVTLTLQAVSGQTSSFTISRSFTNVSGNTISVTEIGIIANLTGWAMTNRATGSAITSDYVLIAYDIPSSAISVLNGQTLTITYTFSVTT